MTQALNVSDRLDPQRTNIRTFDRAHSEYDCGSLPKWVVQTISLGGAELLSALADRTLAIDRKSNQIASILERLDALS